MTVAFRTAHPGTIMDAAALPLQPPQATPIGRVWSMLEANGWTSYMRYLDVVDGHPSDDKPARLRRMAQIAHLGHATQLEIAAAFGVTRMTVHRALRTWREHGEAGFRRPRQPRRRTALDQAARTRAQRALGAGRSLRAVATELSVSHETLRSYVKTGLVSPTTGRPDPLPHADKADRNRRDSQAPLGRAARDVDGRVAASLLGAGPRAPRFEPARAVASGGVLASVPALLEAGLLRHAGQLRGLEGFYGRESILLLQAFLLLARQRNAEQVRHLQAGEWGALLGLDRCPEVKTLRRKIKALAADPERVRSWQDALARDWLEADPDAAATLCVDGHVKVYTGRKGQLKKHFVARQKLCLPAAASYWLNALDGRPFVCLHQDLDPGLVQAVRTEILPCLRELGRLPADWDAAQGPALTLVFDREGWSPKLFRELARQGVACITWRKGSQGVDWDERAFRAATVPICGPGGQTWRTARLAERELELLKGFAVREIRRRLDDGRQVAVVTTHPDLGMERVAGALLSRWTQENYFKYMRSEFALDGLPEHALVAVSADAEVVNPERRELEQTVRRQRARMAQMRNRLAREKDSASRRAVELREAISAHEHGIEALCARRSEVPRRVLAGSLQPEQRLEALSRPTRELLDTLRMIVYRAETALMPPVARALGQRSESARSALKALFSTDASLAPDPTRGTLTVQFLRLADPAHDRALEPLFKQLNATRTIYPGTQLRLIYDWLS